MIRARMSPEEVRSVAVPARINSAAVSSRSRACRCSTSRTLARATRLFSAACERRSRILSIVGCGVGTPIGAYPVKVRPTRRRRRPARGRRIPLLRSMYAYAGSRMATIQTGRGISSGKCATSCCGPLHTAAEEDLCFDQAAVANRDELGIPVALAGRQLVLVEQEDAVIVGRDKRQDFRAGETIRGGEAAFEIRRLVDVVVLRAGEGEFIREQACGRLEVLIPVRVHRCADRVSIRHARVLRVQASLVSWNAGV